MALRLIGGHRPLALGQFASARLKLCGACDGGVGLRFQLAAGARLFLDQRLLRAAEIFLAGGDLFFAGAQRMIRAGLLRFPVRPRGGKLPRSRLALRALRLHLRHIRADALEAAKQRLLQLHQRLGGLSALGLELALRLTQLAMALSDPCFTLIEEAYRPQALGLHPLALFLELLLKRLERPRALFHLPYPFGQGGLLIRKVLRGLGALQLRLLLFPLRFLLRGIKLPPGLVKLK